MSAHDRAQRLLPWYVTGRLAGEEQALMEAHLPACAECRADLVSERALRAAVAAPTSEAAEDWSQARARLTLPPARARRRPAAPSRRAWAPWLGWAVAACQLAWLAPGWFRSPAPAPAFHALASVAARPAGNVLVMFRPGVTEAAMRAALLASDARLADGPTPAGAYLLAVPTGERVGAVAALRRRPAILLAQPVDAGAAR